MLYSCCFLVCWLPTINKSTQKKNHIQKNVKKRVFFEKTNHNKKVSCINKNYEPCQWCYFKIYPIRVCKMRTLMSKIFEIIVSGKYFARSLMEQTFHSWNNGFVYCLLVLSILHEFYLLNQPQQVIWNPRSLNALPFSLNRLN